MCGLSSTIRFVYDPTRHPDSSCVGPRGPCDECREYLDRTYNPRHLPTVIVPVLILPYLVSIMTAETHRYSGDTEDWHTEIVGFISYWLHWRQK